MKKQLSVVVMGTLVGVTGLVWIVSKEQRAITPITTASVPRSPGHLESTAVVQTTTPAFTSVQTPALAAVPVITPAQPVVAVVPVASPAAVVIPPDGSKEHVAQPGETVGSLAADLMGKDNKANRDAIINANPSLKADPDKLLAGKSYTIPSSANAAVATPLAATASTPTAQKPVLKYTAKTGDTVSELAGAFLGSDVQANQDAITKANPSLKADPDHVVAGKSYKIPAPDGLSAAPDSSPTASKPRPTTQPDADQVIAASAPRTLRYTAKAGDTLSTMAIALLGSDTPQTREAIISNNPSLKDNPDRVIAGQMYWIPAPAATATATPQ
jgi:phage tail protein X